jgi:hypothetical protein
LVDWQEEFLGFDRSAITHSPNADISLSRSVPSVVRMVSSVFSGWKSNPEDDKSRGL